MTEKEAKDLCRMIRLGVDLSRKYHPKTTKELRDLIEKLIEERGNEADLNDIDVSQIEDMSEVFAHSQFNGDISNWDVSEVWSMSEMFACSKFNGDISNWNVSKVENMSGIFRDSEFKGDISKWSIIKPGLILV